MSELPHREENIHFEGSALLAMYGLNVVSALTIYSNALFLVVLLPFQSQMIPEGTGPSWLYASGGLLLVFQYYLWALEMAGYWFKPEAVKALLLADEDIVGKWFTNALYWGGILTAFVVANVRGYLDIYLA